MNINRYQKEKPYQVDFQMIWLKHLRESKYLIENKNVQTKTMEKFVVIVPLKLKWIVLIARWRELVNRV